MASTQKHQVTNEKNQVFTREIIGEIDPGLYATIMDMHTQRPTEPLEILHDGKVLYSSVEWWYRPENAKYHNFTGS